MPSDTHPEAERVQIELLRKATVAERIARVRSLTATVTRLSRAAIARAHPELSPLEVKLAWVRLHYGDALADGLRQHLREHGDT